MKLVLKTMERAGGRSMYLCFPEGEPRTAFKRSVMTVLRDDAAEASVRELLEKYGLGHLADDRQVILAFPNPLEGGWNWALEEGKPDDLEFLTHIQGELNSEEESRRAPQPATQGQLSRTMRDMQARMGQTWHPMNDTKYIAGFGSGASMACTLAALKPTFAAGVFIDGGEFTPKAVREATWAAMPAWLVHCPRETVSYFQKANGAMVEKADGGTTWYRSAVNPYQRMVVTQGTGKALLAEAYDGLLRHVRRPNTGSYGDIERRLVPELDYKFEIFEEDTRLEDGLPHTWFTHVPESVKARPERKVPLLVFFHGASDNPAEAAEMSKFHELGEREGFITVYPWGTNRLTWNSAMEEGAPDDDRFSMALIDYMIAHYPVDSSRVYLSGFSNGAAQAQAVALCHPDRIAAICPIDSNWPGSRMGESEVDTNDVIPMRIGLEKKARYDYRIPVWYTYGNREPSYPVFNKSTQQHQYDYWKRYNHVTILPTPPMDRPHPCGCGVPGDVYERITPSLIHPHHAYDAQRFLTDDPGRPNLYNYVVMLDKGHDIAEKDPELGWNFVSQFRRESDGSISRVEPK